MPEWSERQALFLDFDETLVEFAETPPPPARAGGADRADREGLAGELPADYGLPRGNIVVESEPDRVNEGTVLEWLDASIPSD